MRPRPCVCSVKIKRKNQIAVPAVKITHFLTLFPEVISDKLNLCSKTESCYQIKEKNLAPLFKRSTNVQSTTIKQQICSVWTGWSCLTYETSPYVCSVKKTKKRNRYSTINNNSAAEVTKQLLHRFLKFCWINQISVLRPNPVFLIIKKNELSAFFQTQYIGAIRYNKSCSGSFVILRKMGIIQELDYSKWTEPTMCIKNNGCVLIFL